MGPTSDLKSSVAPLTSSEVLVTQGTLGWRASRGESWEAEANLGWARASLRAVRVTAGVLLEKPGRFDAGTRARPPGAPGVRVGWCHCARAS